MCPECVLNVFWMCPACIMNVSGISEKCLMMFLKVPWMYRECLPSNLNVTWMWMCLKLYSRHFPASDQKFSFTKFFSFIPRNSKLIFKIRNGIIQEQMEISIPPKSLWSKNFFYNIFSIFTMKVEVKISFGHKAIISSLSKLIIK